MVSAEPYLIAVPAKKENLRLAIGKAHRRYTRRINFREGWRGHLWQERFSSFVKAREKTQQAQQFLIYC